MADSKISALSPITTVDGDEVIPIVDDPSGTPASKKITVANLLAGRLPLTGGTLTGDLVVPDEAYDATNWNGSLEVPTKNAVRDKIEALGGGGGSSAYCGVQCQLTSQSISDSSVTALNWTAEDLDSDGFHDNSTNNTRWTVPSGKDGKYLVHGHVTFNANASGLRQVYVEKNGSTVQTIRGDKPDGSYKTNVPFSVVVSLAATDYVEIAVYQDSGGSLSVLGLSDNTGYTQAGMHLIGT